MTWYTWLEQGRQVAASAHVIDALARALVLNADQHQHLRDLAGLPALEPTRPALDVVPRLQRLVDAVAPNLACVYDIHFDYLAGMRRMFVCATIAARSPTTSATF